MRWFVSKKDFARFAICHKLWLIGIALAICCVAVILAFVRKKHPVQTTESVFSISCYFGQADFFCKDNPNKKKICNAKLAEMFVESCAHLQAIGVRPESPVKIKVEVIDKCDKEEEKRSGCMHQAVWRERPIHGFNGDIYFWHESLEKWWMPSIVAHEMTHIFAGKMYYRTSRIVGEFFAVYAQIFLSRKTVHDTCFGIGWNQRGLATDGGNYPYPQDPSFPLKSGMVRSCRYGQLEFLAREARKINPLFLTQIWDKYIKSGALHVDPALLLTWIKEIDVNVGELAQSFYILKSVDSLPHILVVPKDDSNLMFVYQLISKDREKFFNGLRAAAYISRRGVMIGEPNILSPNDASSVWLDLEDAEPGDLVFLEATVRDLTLRDVMFISN